MKLKTLILLIVTTALIGSSAPMANANNAKQVVNNTQTITTADTTKAHALISRLNEIRDMDKSALTFAQKRELRKEVRDINKELKQEGILLTLGLIGVIAILLLIILKPF